MKKVDSGYAGGVLPNPTYEEVCTGTAGHAEVVQIIFDPTVISFKELLEIFFSTHDPTTLNRQGADVGTQYRSIIFYHNTNQKLAAERLIKEINEAKIWKNPVVTQIEPYKAFYNAEEYHKNYFKKNPNQPYCRIIIKAKIDKFKKAYGERIKDK